MNKKLGDLFLEAAAKVCKEVKILKKRPHLAKLIFHDDAVLYIQGRPRLNEQGARESIRDKEIAGLILESEGIHTPRSHLFFITGRKIPKTVAQLRATEEYAALQAFIQKVGWPIFLKPNKGSQGKGVMRILEKDMDVLDKQLLAYAQTGRRSIPLTQEALHGEEYRVVVAFGEILLAVHRKPFNVEGDGVSTISDLVKQRLAALKAQRRRVKLKHDSHKIDLCLSQQGLTRDTVLEKGRVVPVIANKNLSDGATPFICTEYIRERYADLAYKIYDRLGVNFVGLDLIEDTRTGQIVPYVLEINANPGFSQLLNSSPKNADAIRTMFVKQIEKMHKRKVQEKRNRAAQDHKKDRKAKRKTAPDAKDVRQRLVVLIKKRVGGASPSRGGPK